MRAALPLVILATVACGTPLHLHADDSGGQGGDGNSTVDTTAALKCHTGAITGAQLSNCTCSTDGNQPCPMYTGDPNAAAGAWDCTTIAISGGYYYSCECRPGADANAMASDPNAAATACGNFYNPADPNALPKTQTPITTCQTAPTSFGFQTTCTCTDTDAAPCDFYQGNSYTNTTTTYVEVCASTLHADGVTTVCTCNQTLQSNNATCPDTFTPNASTVTDLIY